MPEMNLGGVLCGKGDSAADSASDPVPTCIHSDDLFDEVAGRPYVGLLHRLSGLGLSQGPPDETVKRMLGALARGLRANLACIVRQNDGDLVLTRHSTRSAHSLGGDTLSAAEDPVLRAFIENGCPAVCEAVRESCGETGFFRRGLSISAFALFPVNDPECERRGLLITWKEAAPNLGSEHLVALGSMANLVGAVLKMSRLTDDLEFERDSRRRYTRLIAGREVRMAELKSENAKLKELVMELSHKIGDLERA
ncbi:MAG: hypothetical protein PVF95_04200 [bacterium]|jgi:hypothetical protein